MPNIHIKSLKCRDLRAFSWVNFKIWSTVLVWQISCLTHTCENESSKPCHPLEAHVMHKWPLSKFGTHIFGLSKNIVFCEWLTPSTHIVQNYLLTKQQLATGCSGSQAGSVRVHTANILFTIALLCILFTAYCSHFCLLKFHSIHKEQNLWCKFTPKKSA